MHSPTFEISQTKREATIPKKRDVVAAFLVLRKFGETKQVHSVARSIIASEKIKQSNYVDFVHSNQR